tara:strand:+ start:546 stop:890 length:345 start_codon:yes stop_codon:yes gene_type:complete
MKKYVYLIMTCLFFSCKSDAELSMERGIKYFDWGKYDQAILEFNKAKYFQLNDGKQSYDDLKLLAHTHYNLAITYAKLGNLKKADDEAQRAFTLIPKQEYDELIGLISDQMQTK